MRLAIGIDTGGTFTDAVLYDLEEKKILASAKSPTTKEDLKIGILKAMDELPEDKIKEATLLSLSTTLATNACVEERGRRARLFFFGGDMEIVKKYGPKYGLSEEEVTVIPCKSDIYGNYEMPDWEDFVVRARAAALKGEGIGIIELYAFKNGAAIEKEAKKKVLPYTNLISCGYEMFEGLNSLQRAAGTLLNLKLIKIIEEFLDGAKAAAKERGIEAPIVVLRSDGSLMSEAYARKYPVETLLCGPAASLVGGFALSGEKNCIIADMGGTTTDIALVREGMPVTDEEGVKVGRYRTYVKGASIRTVGLGGDSAVHVKRGKLVLEDYKVTPVCAALCGDDRAKAKLKELISSGKAVHSRPRHEFYFKIKDASLNMSPRDKALIEALSRGTLIMTEAAAAYGQDEYSFDPSSLIREGYIGVAGLTPTDIMHIKGDYDKFDREAAYLAAEVVALNLGISANELADLVYDEVVKKLYKNILKAALCWSDPIFKISETGEERERFIEKSYLYASGKEKAELMEVRFLSKYKIVGLGAPIGLFLERTAKLLGAQTVLPENYQVANAVGAVSGNVTSTVDAIIRMVPTQEKANFSVYFKSGTERFKDYESAFEYAKSCAAKEAEKITRDKGAKGDISVSLAVREKKADVYSGNDDGLFLETVIRATAAGKIFYEK